MTGRSCCDKGRFMLDRTEVGQSVDVLADILETVHVQSAAVSTILPDPTWSNEADDSDAVVILVVRAGQFIGEFVGESIEIAQGDAVAILRGTKQAKLALAGSTRHSGIELSPRVRELSSGTEHAPSLLKCTCRFADPERNPLLGSLPRLVHVARRQWVDPHWLGPTISWIEREAGLKTPGSTVVVGRLVELLWVQLVRTHIATTPVATHGWLRALSDEQIGGALCLIHEQPAVPFTVAGLAQSVGMSRSAFASQFTRLVGEPPLHYVARWRMLKASQLLKDDKQTLAEVAVAVGYESEAAFSKAFKRWSGQAPGSYRRSNRSDIVAAAQMLAG